MMNLGWIYLASGGLNPCIYNLFMATAGDLAVLDFFSLDGSPFQMSKSSSVSGPSAVNSSSPAKIKLSGLSEEAKNRARSS